MKAFGGPTFPFPRGGGLGAVGSQGERKLGPVGGPGWRMIEPWRLGGS